VAPAAADNMQGGGERKGEGEEEGGGQWGRAEEREETRGRGSLGIKKVGLYKDKCSV
jgi:hypothetical protein